MQTNPLISVVLIVYNCEKYIGNCLESLCTQDCREINYEVIVTDDGSTDISGKICDEYAAKFPFVHVTHTQNFGESHARNTGLKQCRGKYITFCDGDDAVSPYLISVITRAIQVHDNPDIIFFKHFIELPEKGWPVYDIQNMKQSEAEYIDGETLAIRCTGYLRCFVWNKVFKSEIAKSVPFNETIKVIEDFYWLIEVLNLHRNIRVCCINYYLYYYIQHIGFGQTRALNRMYDENGMRRSIFSCQKALEIPNLSPRIAVQIKGEVYETIINSLYANQVKISDEVYKEYKYYIKQYAYDYYLKRYSPFIFKVKKFVKHILIIFHIHKKIHK